MIINDIYEFEMRRNTNIKDKVSTWILASRPKTLPAAASPVIVGSAFAFRDGAFKIWPAFAALIAALLLQIGANLANDVFDFERGADTQERLGPRRVTQTGLLRSEEVKAGMWIVFVLAGLIGLYLVFEAGWPILLIGVFAILAAITYTGGPIPLGYYGLGDLAVFIFFGLVAVVGTYYVQAHTLRFPVVWASIPVGLLITAILVVNNLRDIQTDQRAGKRTLAVRIGVNGTRIEYLVCISVAYVIPVMMWGFGMVSIWAGLVLVSLPLSIQLVESIWNVRGSALNKALTGTGQLVLFYSVLLSLGVNLPVMVK